MKITSKEIEIKKPEKIDSKYIESELEKLGIEPLRWAIVKVNEDTFTLSVSFKQ